MYFFTFYLIFCKKAGYSKLKVLKHCTGNHTLFTEQDSSKMVQWKSNLIDSDE